MAYQMEWLTVVQLAALMALQAVESWAYLLAEWMVDTQVAKSVERKVVGLAD